jgi:hypothetical protein
VARKIALVTLVMVALATFLIVAFGQSRLTFLHNAIPLSGARVTLISGVLQGPSRDERPTYTLDSRGSLSLGWCLSPASRRRTLAILTTQDGVERVITLVIPILARTVIHIRGNSLSTQTLLLGFIPTSRTNTVCWTAQE